jgi:hypothetical protein
MSVTDLAWPVRSVTVWSVLCPTYLPPAHGAWVTESGSDERGSHFAGDSWVNNGSARFVTQAELTCATHRVFKQNGDHDGKPDTTSVTQVRKGFAQEGPAEADLEPGFQSRRTPKLPVCDETAMEKGCFSGIVPFNRGCLEPISVEDIRDSYPEQKKLNEKIVEEGWDMVSPVNARQEARSRKGHDSRGVAREA